MDHHFIIPMNFDKTSLKMINSREGVPWPVGRGTRAHVITRLDLGQNGAMDHITVKLDDALVVDWHGSAYAVGQTGEKHPQFPDQDVTSLYSHKDSYKVTVWKLRIFDGEAKVLR